MKKIAAACALALASFALLSAQAQVPGFSNTVHAAVGQSVEKNAQIKFLGFTEYFTGNVTVGKITFTGDIAWQLIPGPGGVETRFGDHNINVVINPVRGFDIGLGTNLNWTVGPGPSSGPQWSAYDKPYYGGINLEDIKAPQCFDIENELKKTLDIPVFHDDQHGTAIVVVSALLNAYKYLDRDLKTAKIVINGAGAAGQAIARLLFSYGIQTVVLCDTTGAVYEGRTENMNPYKDALAKVSNRQKEKGTLAQIIKGKDIFIGVSAPGSLTPEMIKSMNADPVIMAMANPVPEILPDEAKAAGARIVCTGRSDFPNQVNNLLAFPGIFRGALDVRAKEINDEMKIAAANAIASLIPECELNETNIIASPLDPRVAPTVAAAVAKAALDTGVARLTDITPEAVAAHTRELLGHTVA